MDPGPDLEHHHHHHAGPRWLDMILALSAILISGISLSVAVQHGKTMEQMVKATTWPNLEMANSDLAPSGDPQISLEVINSGVGPARIEDFEVTYAGRPIHSGVDLLTACCTPPARPHYINSTVPGRVLPAKDTIPFFVAQRSAMTDAQWAQLKSALPKVRSTICYCSVLDECWTNDSEKNRPVEVKACPEPKALYKD